MTIHSNALWAGMSGFVSKVTSGSQVVLVTWPSPGPWPKPDNCSHPLNGQFGPMCNGRHTLLSPPDMWPLVQTHNRQEPVYPGPPGWCQHPWWCPVLTPLSVSGLITSWDSWPSSSCSWSQSPGLRTRSVQTLSVQWKVSSDTQIGLLTENDAKT